MFELVFPPGVEDDRVKEIAYNFATSQRLRPRPPVRPAGGNFVKQ